MTNIRDISKDTYQFVTSQNHCPSQAMILKWKMVDLYIYLIHKVIGTELNNLQHNYYILRFIISQIHIIIIIYGSNAQDEIL